MGKYKRYPPNTLIGSLSTYMLLNIHLEEMFQTSPLEAELLLGFPFVIKQTLKIAMDSLRTNQLHRLHVNITVYFIR
jgi:hypothetical protein